MGKAIPQQHPAVVLRSRYDQIRTLLVLALIAMVSLSVAVVIVANESDETVRATEIAPRYDGGPEEGSADVMPQSDGLPFKVPVRGALVSN